MSYLKPQVSFSLDFASLFSVMRDTLLYFFYLEVYMIWTKASQQRFKAKFEGKLTCAFKNHMKNLANFHRLENSGFILEVKWEN